MSAVADKLDEARALIEKGWCQGRMKDGCGSYCLYGALDAVLGGAPVFDNDEPIWRELIAVTGGDPIQWNDAPERTQAEVIEAFRKAAELARAEAQS